MRAYAHVLQRSPVSCLTSYAASVNVDPPAWFAGFGALEKLPLAYGLSGKCLQSLLGVIALGPQCTLHVSHTTPETKQVLSG